MTETDLLHHLSIPNTSHKFEVSFISLILSELHPYAYVLTISVAMHLRFIVIIDLCLCQSRLTNLDPLILFLDTRVLMIMDSLFQVCVGDRSQTWLSQPTQVDV